MTELIQLRSCLNYGLWRTLSIWAEIADPTLNKAPEIEYNIQLSTDHVVTLDQVFSKRES